MGEQGNDGGPENTPREKPQPDEKHKEKAAEMMTAYQDRPTLVLPGTGGAVSGTAVNDWVDDEGNPKYSGDKESADEDQVAKDKSFNEAVLKAAKEKSPDENAGPAPSAMR